MQTGEECKGPGGSGGERENGGPYVTIMTYGLVLLLEFSGREGGGEK
jgi:hypothetical protein